MKINERFIWAVSVLSPGPSDHILEIGCGAGMLTEQIALQLKSGSITAIDKSKPMMKLAEQRNKSHIQSGKVKLITADFTRTKLEAHYFDKIVAFNVNIFWKGSEKDFEIIHHCLKPKGRLYVFYQTPSGADRQLAQQITEKLQANNFAVVDTVFEKSFCIISKS